MSDREPPQRRTSDPVADELGRGARFPSDIPHRGWREVMGRVWQGISDNSLAALAAATAFYAFLAIPSGFSAAIAFFGLASDEGSVERLLALLQGQASPEVLDMVRAQFRFLVAQPRGMLISSLALSVAVTLGSAMSASRTMMTALNAAYAEHESRSLAWYVGVLALITAAGIAFLIAALGILVLLPIAIEWLPVRPSWRAIAIALRWPALIVLFGFGLAMTYRLAPSRAIPKWRWVSWGAVAAVIVWLLACVAVSYYTAHFASYERIYGSLAGVALLLIWLYASAFAIALGAQINAEIERQATRRTSPRRNT